MDVLARKKSIFRTITLSIGSIFILWVIFRVLYEKEHRRYLMREMETFYITIDIGTLEDIERMEYVICGEMTLVDRYNDEDGTIVWGKNIPTPKQFFSLKNVSCPVEIRIFQNGKMTQYIADQPFNCPDCDGSHSYKLREHAAIYTYSP